MNDPEHFSESFRLDFNPEVSTILSDIDGVACNHLYERCIKPTIFSS